MYIFSKESLKRDIQMKRLLHIATGYVNIAPWLRTYIKKLIIGESK